MVGWLTFCSEEERHHDRSPSSDYSTDVPVICRVFDGSAEVDDQHGGGSAVPPEVS